jgi:hypothetical protein
MLFHGCRGPRHDPQQFELFPDGPMPPKTGLIAGLAVHLDRPCGCGVRALTLHDDGNRRASVAPLVVVLASSALIFSMIELCHGVSQFCDAKN